MKRLISVAVLSLSSTLAFAAPISFDGEIAVQTKPQNTGLTDAQPLHFKLPRVKLSPEAQQLLHNQLSGYPKNAYKPLQSSSELPAKIDLGMEKTPVLNQGAHGSCVTFAVTAAMDAALGAGDYISQLCSLELGSWLAINDKAYVSGWNGSFGAWVFEQMMEHGIISKNRQKTAGCAGVYKYPLQDPLDEGNPMTEAEYSTKSIPISRLITWEPILQPSEAFDAGYDPNMKVWLAKEHLAKGQRLTIGTLIDINVGQIGAQGSYNASFDTWMLTPEVVMDAVNGEIQAGHEMVVIGYDDFAVVEDENGYLNQGLFKLRNSWSDQAGDGGNYYMTYDHFKFLVNEIAAVRVKH